MRISVITVSLNSVKTIERTIQSVIRQSYDGLEYIIIDGGSTDGTTEIIKRYEDYIAYWISEKDDGIYDAMNKGIARSTGEIIAFLNSDDWYEENTLVKVNHYYEKHNPMILTGRLHILKKGKWIKYSHILGSDEENIRMAMIYQHPATFARREVFERFGGFHTGYKIAADFEWMLRMYDSNIEIMCVEDVFTNFSSKGISNMDTERTIRETRGIALDALEQCERYSRREKEAWRKRINECYDEQQAIVDVKRIIKNLQLADYPELKSSMQDYFTEQSYAVWGIGVIGEEMHNLLTQLGLDVSYFVDKKAGTIQTFHNRKVLEPQKLVRAEKIIIATSEYEEEIADRLDELGFWKNRDYILCSTVLLKLAEAYKACYLREK